MSEKRAEYKIDGRPKTIFRTVKSKDNPYVMMDRRPIDNNCLSFKAKGILIYLLSRPDGWEINLVDLANRSTDGLAAVKSGVRELQEAGHLRHSSARNTSGQIVYHLWEVYEVPQVENRLMDTPICGGEEELDATDKLPEVEKPQGGLSTSGKSPASNIKYLNNKEDNNKEGEKQKNLDILQRAVFTFCNKNDFLTWRRLEADLQRPGVNISQTDHTIKVAGLGMKADFYAQRYGKSINRSLVGILNCPEAQVVFEG